MSSPRSVRVATALTAAVFAFALSGCDAVADRAVQEAEQAVEDATGVAVDAGAEDKLPEGWPQDVPIFPDARIPTSASVQTPDGTLHSAQLVTPEPFQDVVDWYDAELEAQGWTVEQRFVTGSGDASTAALTATKGTLQIIAAISVSQAEVTVDLQVFDRPQTP